MNYPLIAKLRHVFVYAVWLLVPYLMFAYTVPVGASRDEVVAAYGYPASQAKTGDRELLNYKEGAVVLENSRVIEFRFTRGEPALVKRQTSQPPATKPVNIPVPQQPKPAPVPIVQPYQALPISVTYQPPRGMGIGLWIVLVPALAILFVGTAVLKYKLRQQRNGGLRKNRNHEFLDYKSVPTPAIPAPAITRLTREALDRLEWRRFEELIHGYFETQGWSAQRSRVGADGGIDIFLYRPEQPKPGACVQCKAWHTYTVGVKPVRELFGVMAANNIPEGFFVTTSGYTTEALAFAEGKSLHLLTGSDILSRFSALPEADHVKIISHAFRGDFETPTCPSCDEKMVRREAETPFWGCRNYPKCRRTFKLREV